MTDMQPENPQPQFGPERASVEHLQNAERLPKLPTPEKGGIETGAERAEQAAESRAAIVDMPTTIAPTPTAAVPSPVVDGGASSAPLAADDSDLIEKEWVDRAKKIIQETHDDPAKREQQVSALQKDYLRKRYGKELGAA
jgi:hypothetical protein